MFERDTLRDEFDDILRHKRQLAERLTGILSHVQDPAVRQKIAELQGRAEHHVELTERLVEIVS